MRWIKIVPFLFITSFSFCNQNSPGQQKVRPIYDFSKGLDTYHSSLSLPDGYVQSSLNGFFDAQAPFSKRAGYQVVFSTKQYAFQQAWTYTDPTNTSWIIVRASDTLIANNLTGGTSVKIATVSINNLVGETNAFGDAYFVDQSQGVYFWNGTTTTYVSGSPMGSLITQFNGYLWVAGAPVPNSNQIYSSAYYNGTNWTTGGTLTTSPQQLSVGLQDNFDSITAMYVYLATLYIGKHYSIYGLTGFGSNTFQINQITQECGILDQNTIQTYAGDLKFVSLRGVEDFNGYTCKRISDPVKNLVDPSIQLGGFQSQSWIQSQTSDWSAGTIGTNGILYSLSTNISAPSVVLSTGVGFIDVLYNGYATSGLNTSAGISLGDYVNESMYNINNWVVTNGGWSVGPLSGTGFQNNLGYGTVDAVLTDESVLEFQYNVNGNCGSSHPLTSPGIFDIALINSSGNGYGVSVQRTGGTLNVYSGYYTSWTTTGLNSNSLSVKSSNLSCDSNWHTVDLFRFPSNGEESLYIDGTSIGNFTNTSYSNLTELVLDSEEFDSPSSAQYRFIKSQSTYGTYTSPVYDTEYYSPLWDTFQATDSGSGGTIGFAMRTSNSPTSGFSSDTAVTVGNVPSIQSQRYVVYSTTLTNNTSGALSTVPKVVNPQIGVIASTGSFASQIHSLGSISSWGNFLVNEYLTGTGDNIAFSLCSSTNSNMGYPESCASQIPNSQITIATGTYVQFFATFSVTSNLQNPTLNSVTVQWFNGSRVTPMSSTVWDDRYWLSLTTTTLDTANDGVLVLGQSGAWSLLSIHAGGFTQYKGSLYHSDSTATGNVYIDNVGTSDNGAKINTYLITKDFKSDDLNADNYFNSMYMSMDDLGSNCSGTIYYFLDHNESVPFTLSTVSQSEFSNTISDKIPFALGTNQNFGHTIAFEYDENDTCGLNLYGFSPYYFERPVQ